MKVYSFVTSSEHIGLKYNPMWDEPITPAESETVRDDIFGGLKQIGIYTKSDQRFLQIAAVYPYLVKYKEKRSGRPIDFDVLHLVEATLDTVPVGTVFWGNRYESMREVMYRASEYIRRINFFDSSSTSYGTRDTLENLIDAADPFKFIMHVYRCRKALHGKEPFCESTFSKELLLLLMKNDELTPYIETITSRYHTLKYQHHLYTQEPRIINELKAMHSELKNKEIKLSELFQLAEHFINIHVNAPELFQVKCEESDSIDEEGADETCDA